MNRIKEHLELPRAIQIIKDRGQQGPFPNAEITPYYKITASMGMIIGSMSGAGMITDEETGEGLKFLFRFQDSAALRDAIWGKEGGE
jgi:hypothetical protein